MYSNPMSGPNELKDKYMQGLEERLQLFQEKHRLQSALVEKDKLLSDVLKYVQVLETHHSSPMAFQGNLSSAARLSSLVNTPKTVFHSNYNTPTPQLYPTMGSDAEFSMARAPAFQTSQMLGMYTQPHMNQAFSTMPCKIDPSFVQPANFPLSATTSLPGPAHNNFAMPMQTNFGMPQQEHGVIPFESLQSSSFPQGMSFSDQMASVPLPSPVRRPESAAARVSEARPKTKRPMTSVKNLRMLAFIQF